MGIICVFGLLCKGIILMPKLHISHLCRCLLGNMLFQRKSYRNDPWSEWTKYPWTFFLISLWFYLKYYNVNILNWLYPMWKYKLQSGSQSIYILLGKVRSWKRRRKKRYVAYIYLPSVQKLFRLPTHYASFTYNNALIK